MDMTMVRLGIRRLGGSDVLAGAGTGRKLCAALLAETGSYRDPTVCLLDFTGVSVATASFLRECVVRFRDALRSPTSAVYPVVAGPNQDVREELDDLLRARGDAIACCRLNADGDPIQPTLLGLLEPKQQRAFDLLRKLGQADASTLMETDDEREGVGQTAWNNRLAALAAKGLVIETYRGRTKLYSPVLKGI
jgi:hypothetical protein